jgi:hypothetical protein
MPKHATAEISLFPEQVRQRPSYNRRCATKRSDKLASRFLAATTLL